MAQQDEPTQGDYGQDDHGKGEYGRGEYGQGETVAVYGGETPRAASALEAAIIILSVVAVFIWLVLR